jgi:hypothetical protein
MGAGACQAASLAGWGQVQHEDLQGEAGVDVLFQAALGGRQRTEESDHLGGIVARGLGVQDIGQVEVGDGVLAVGGQQEDVAPPFAPEVEDGEDGRSIAGEAAGDLGDVGESRIISSS